MFSNPSLYVPELTGAQEKELSRYCLTFTALSSASTGLNLCSSVGIFYLESLVGLSPPVKCLHILPI